MFGADKSLIDNWSLEQTAGILQFDADYYIGNEEELFSSIGGLSNFINAILLYKTPCYLLTGNEFTWQRFTNFKNNLESYIQSLEPIEKNFDYIKSHDKGANYYLLTSKYFDAELFLSSERSTKIMNKGIDQNDNLLFEVLEKIDNTISTKVELIDSKNLRCGIQNNFLLPSLTHYVLSQATSKNDLLEVILQIKRSKKIFNLNDKVYELHSNINSYTKFQKELNLILKKEFNENDSENTLSVGINVLFLALSKNINIDFLYQKTYMTYLKDIISCRTETYGLKKHISRIFGIDITKLNTL